MQVWNALHAARCKYRTQKSRQKSPSRHHRTTLSGHIFTTKACIDNPKKNLLSSNNSSTCPDNMVNFGPLTAEIGSGVWDTLQISTGFASWERYCTASSSGRQLNFAALNRGRHLCSAVPPSGWALAHILVMDYLLFCFTHRARGTLVSQCRTFLCYGSHKCHWNLVKSVLHTYIRNEHYR